MVVAVGTVDSPVFVIPDWHHTGTPCIAVKRSEEASLKTFIGQSSVLIVLMMTTLVVGCGPDDELEQQEVQTGRGTAAGDMPMMQGDMPMQGGDMPMQQGEVPMQQMPMMQDDMPEWMMSRGGAGMMEAMPTIHLLLANHEQIERDVEEIPGGVRTVTTSGDPVITEAIRDHVHQMKERVEDGRPIRMMDPVFREIFKHHGKIEMEIEEVPGGVRVTETSSDPQVVLLIRQHAKRAVSEFVDQGMPRAMQPTPLPEGYGSGVAE